MVKAGGVVRIVNIVLESVYYQTGIDIYSLLKISEIKAIALT